MIQAHVKAVQDISEEDGASDVCNGMACAVTQP